MAGPFQFQSPKSLRPPLRPSGTVAAARCDDIDALDAELAALVGRTLALSDGLGPDANGDLTWMIAKVIPLTRTGLKPCVSLSPVEFELLGHSRRGDRIDLAVEGGCGTRGELRLQYPRSGWRLYVVTPIAPPSAAPTPAAPPELADEPEKDAEDSARRKRDDIFRRMFG